MTQRLKITLIVLGSLGACFVLALVGGLTFLRSAAGSRWILGKVRSTLAAKGMQLDFSEGSLDILHGLHLRNVHVQQKSDGVDLDAKIRAIDVEYDLSLLHRKLTVSLASIDHPTVRYHTDKEAAPPPPPPPAKSGNPAASARHYFQSPPVSLAVEKFQLVALDLDFESKTAAQALAARFPDTSLSAALAFEARHLAANGELHSTAANRVVVSQHAETKQSEIEVDPTASATWSLTLAPEGDHAHLTLAPSKGDFGISRLAIKQSAGNDGMDFTIRDLRVHSEVQAEGRIGQPLADGPSEMTKGNASVVGRIGPGRGAQRHGKTVSPLGFDGQELDLTAAVADDIALDFGYQLRHLLASALRHPIDARLKAKVKLAKNLTQFHGESSAELAGREIANAKADGRVDGGLRVTKTATIRFERGLADLLKNGASLKPLGAAQIDLDNDFKLPGSYTGFLELLAIADPQAKVENDLKVRVTQTQAGSLPLKFAPLNATVHAARADAQWKVQAAVENASLQAKKLHLPAEAIALQGTYGPEKDRAAVEGSWKIGGEEALKFHGNTTVGEQQVQFDGTVEALLGRYLDSLTGNQIVAQYGQWRTTSELKVDARLPDAEATGGFAKTGTVHANGTTRVEQILPEGAKPKVRLAQPIALKEDIALEKGKGTVDITGDLPSLQMIGVGKYEGLQLTMQASTPDAAAAQDIDFSIRTKPGRVYLPNAPELTGFDVDVQARVRGKDRFELPRASVDFNHGMVKLTADGSGNVRAQNFLLKGDMQAQVPPKFPAVVGHRATGSAHFPWNLYVRHGTEMDFDGTMTLDQIGWSHGAQRLSGMTGRVPVSEKLVRKGVHIEFAHLITQNPFERVDFDRLRPLIHRADQLRIEQIGFEEKTYGPLYGYFSLSQNMLFARQFDLSVGTRGAAYGEMYFNFHPQALQLGMLARLTALDLVEILPKKYLVKTPGGDRKLSGRAGMVVNLHRGTVDGRVDITEIGAGQLITMINVLDPQFKDQKMNLARTALGVGYPTFVGMVFENGYLDLGFDLHALGVDKHIDVRSIPISSMVTSASAEVVKKTKGVPLK